MMIFMPFTIVNGKYEQKRGTCLRKIAECLHYICSMSSCNKIRQKMGPSQIASVCRKCCCLCGKQFDGTLEVKQSITIYLCNCIPRYTSKRTENRYWNQFLYIYIYVYMYAWSQQHNSYYWKAEMVQNHIFSFAGTGVPQFTALCFIVLCR